MGWAEGICPFLDDCHGYHIIWASYLHARAALTMFGFSDVITSEWSERMESCLYLYPSFVFIVGGLLQDESSHRVATTAVGSISFVLVERVVQRRTSVVEIVFGSCPFFGG
jgi:hypothetical protein